MSDMTLRIMQEQLKIAEQYISDLEAASGKEELMLAINTCSKNIKDQYEDLEKIADDFCTRFADDAELKTTSTKIGKLLGHDVTKYYGKMGPYMADADFMEAFANFDIVVGNNPLFGVNEFGADVASNVSHAIAGSMDSVATHMLAETTEITDETIDGILTVMNDFLSLSKRYVERMQEASTARKAVEATDAFVSNIKKQIPEMKKYSDTLKLIMAKKDKPEAIMKAADELKKTLGDDLKAVMRDKDKILNEQKVQKAVSKLGTVLNEVPF